MRLEAGHFYKAKNGETWCCWRVRENAFAEEHASADCIRVSDGRVEYFYADGRYDGHGVREHCLVEEIPRRERATPDPNVIGAPPEDHAALVEYAKVHDEDLRMIRKLRAWVEKAWPLIAGHTWPAGDPKTRTRRELIEERGALGKEGA